MFLTSDRLNRCLVVVTAVLLIGVCPPTRLNAQTKPGPNAEVKLDAKALLAMQLPSERLEDGWVRLFDGQTLFGWSIAGNGNWQVRDGAISVDQGDRSYLYTNFQLDNYELQMDFRSDATTNSGVFLRTPPFPGNVAQESLELNIAPADNPFPTGSFVQRKRVALDELSGQDSPGFDAELWHTYSIRIQDRSVEVTLDGQPIVQLENVQVSPSGHISLQLNSGRVEFRNILIRPIQSQKFKMDSSWASDWNVMQKKDANMVVSTSDSGLRLTGGLGQIQSKQSFDNFFLQARYHLAGAETNSGIFFRCLPDVMLDGYECQLNHWVKDNDPTRPMDAGAGAIFRRQAARVVVGDGTQATYVSVLASGPTMATWVNGIPVASFTDDRKEDPNPRRGLSLKAGPISLQAHDAKTDVTFERLSISPLK